jgi:hypothetical protein
LSKFHARVTDLGQRITILYAPNVLQNISPIQKTGRIKLSNYSLNKSFFLVIHTMRHPARSNYQSKQEKTHNSINKLNLLTTIEAKIIYR